MILPDMVWEVFNIWEFPHIIYLVGWHVLCVVLTIGSRIQKEKSGTRWICHKLTSPCLGGDLGGYPIIKIETF